jgi:hypothetical protein
MGFIAPFVPMIAGAIGGMIGGKKATASAQKRSPEEAMALGGAQGAGTALAGQGKSQFDLGTSMVNQGQATLAGPTSYYQKLLGGNRALASQAVAAPRGAITDVYRGAERSLEQGGVRGAARDVAKGELGRQRAGQISSLLTGVQPGAAEALTGIGQTQTGQGAGVAGQGIGATGQAGNVFAELLGQGAENRQYARQEGQNFGSSFGGLIFDLLKGVGGKKGGGLLSSSQSTPNWTSWMPS